MSNAEDMGVCPLCRSTGHIGIPCGVAHGRPVRFLPPEYLLEPDQPVDDMVGRLWAGLLVVRKLGMGGAGAVFLALQGPLRLPVALKILLPGAASPHGFGKSRFRREAKAMARLQHPGIVRLLSYDTHDGRPYIVMEYVENAITLWKAMRSHKLDVRKARDVLDQLVDIVSAMHRAGIVHRDIKPGNVMVQMRDGRCTVRLLDFGLAKMLDEGTATAQIAGTLTHMAPEQLAAGKVGPWTDYYALGVMATEMFLGTNPFTVDGERPLLETRLDSKRDPVASFDHPVPPPVASFVRRALCWHPRDRLRTPEAFRTALFDAAVALGADELEARGNAGCIAAELLGNEIEPPAVPRPKTSLFAGRPWAVVGVAALLGALGGASFYYASRGQGPVTVRRSAAAADDVVWTPVTPADTGASAAAQPAVIEPLAAAEPVDAAVPAAPGELEAESPDEPPPTRAARAEPRKAARRPTRKRKPRKPASTPPAEELMPRL